MKKFDALIIGGGPAGTTAALILARGGWRVAILERSAYARPRIGETLPPDIRVPLQRLGVWENFRRAGHLESPGIISCWGSAEPKENDFILSPHGCGWHVARAHFDKMLAEAAREAGAEVYLSVAVQRCERNTTDGWCVTAQAGGHELKFHAQWLIDAAGRAGSPGPPIYSYTRYDRLVSCVAFFVARTKGTVRETRTVIEASMEGWWYSAPLPEDQVVIAFMTDADLLPAQAHNAASFYWQRLLGTTLTKRWLTDHNILTTPRRVAAHTSFRQSVGAQRLAVGDAAFAVDPLSSQGVSKALIYGEKAALALLATHAGEQNALPLYATALTHEFASYWRLREQHYHTELRWPEASFWRRRQNTKQNSEIASLANLAF